MIRFVLKKPIHGHASRRIYFFTSIKDIHTALSPLFFLPQHINGLSRSLSFSPNNETQHSKTRLTILALRTFN